MKYLEGSFTLPSADLPKAKGRKRYLWGCVGCGRIEEHVTKEPPRWHCAGCLRRYDKAEQTDEEE